MFKIVEVVLQTDQHFFHRIGIAIIKCGITRHARTDLIEHIIPGILFLYQLDIIGPLRTRSDKGHITNEHIPQLRQFVEMTLTEETSDLRQAMVIVTTLEQRRTPLFRTNLHGTEFIDGKGSAEASDTLLLEDGGSAVFPSYRQITEREQW